MSNKKYFVSFIHGYFHNLHQFSAEENYHLHALKVAKDMGYKPIFILRGNETDKNEMETDPHFDPAIKIIMYKNFFHFLYQIIKYSAKSSVFYVNSYEWQSFTVPFFTRHAIFMAHTQPKRQTVLKQYVQDFVYKFFWRIRLNNVTEKEYLLERGTKEKKLFVVPLVVAFDYFYKKEGDQRKDLVYFGNITKKKNLPTILRAVNIVRKDKPETILNVVGKIMDDEFQKVVDELNLSKNIKTYGFIPLDKLADTLNGNLIYINASFDEGQCVAVYDSALCGCALCLPNIMSFTGVFKDKALFHDVTDYEKLAKNILYYLNNPNKAEKDNEECIAMIKRDYNKEIVEKKMRVLFELN